MNDALAEAWDHHIEEVDTSPNYYNLAASEPGTGIAQSTADVLEKGVGSPASPTIHCGARKKPDEQSDRQSIEDRQSTKEEEGPTADSTIHCPPSKKESGHSLHRLRNRLTHDPAKVDELPDRLRGDNGEAVQWDEGVEQYDRELAGEYNNDDFENTKENRALKRYGKVLYADRELWRRYDDLHIGFVTLRGSPCDENGRWTPPLDYLEKLNESMSNLSYNYGKAVGDLEHEWCAVLAGTGEHATPHWHYIFWVDGEIRPSDFGDMLEAHEDHSPVAGDHPVEDRVRVARVDGDDLEGVGSTELPESARTLKPFGKEDNELGKVAPVTRYVATQLPHIGGVSADRNELEHGVTCWAYTSNTSRKVLRTSGNFPTPGDDESKWSFEKYDTVEGLRADQHDWSFMKADS